MRRVRRICFPLLTALLLVAACTGCGGGNPQIAFCIYDQSDTYISELMGKMTDMLPDTVTAELRDAGNSQAVQNQQILELIDGGADLLVVNTVDRLACSAIVEKCAAAGVDVIFFNREPLRAALRGENVFYVGAEADRLGERQADIVADLFGPQFSGGPYDRNGDGVVQLAILKGEQGHQDAEKRTDTCVNRLKALGFQVEVLAIEVADWNRGDGYAAMERLHLKYGDGIELLFSNNDDMALGAIDYLLEQEVFTLRESGEYDQPFVLVGVDGTVVGLEAVVRGLLYGTVLNDSARQADAVVVLADYLLAGRDMKDFPYRITDDHYIYIDGESITRDNVDNFTNTGE